MEQIFKEYGKLIVATVVAVFLITFFVAGMTYNGESGIFGVLGNINVSEDGDTQIHVTPDELLNMSQGVLPDVALKNQVFSAHTEIPFLAMFTVTKDGTVYEGTQGAVGNFNIALEGVKNKYGNNVYTEMTKEEYDAAEELTYEMFYNKDTGTLYFINPGVYELSVIVQSSGANKGRFVARIVVAPEETT